jgi:hypothetical protein
MEGFILSLLVAGALKRWGGSPTLYEEQRDMIEHVWNYLHYDQPCRTAYVSLDEPLTTETVEALHDQFYVRWY